MSVLNIESLDDELLFDGVPSFSGGVVSNERANQIEQNQSALMVNCDISRFGKLTTRRGTAALGGVVSAATTIQGLINFQTPTFNYLIAMNAGSLYQFDGVSTWTVIGAFTSTNTTTPFAYAMGIDKLYFCDTVAAGPLRSWDGTTLASQDGTNGNTDPPRGISLLTWFTGRIVAVAGANDTLYFSNFLSADAGQWNRITQTFRVGEGEGDPITGLCGWLDFNLIVFKQHSIYLVNCNPSDAATGDIDLMVGNYSIKPVHKKIGCLAPLTAAQVGSDVYFLANDGVRSIRRTVSAENQSETSEALSFPVQDIIDRINLPFINKSCATFRNDRYMVSIPLDSSTTPNYTLVYNVITQSWSGYWTGWTPVVFATRTPTSSPARMVFGQSDGTVSEWLDYVTLSDEVAASFKDRGSAEIATQFLSRAFTFNDPFAPKTGYRMEVEFSSSLTPATVGYLLDGGSTVNFSDNNPVETSLGAALILPFMLPAQLTPVGIVKAPFDLMQLEQFRELQFQVSSTSGKLSTRTVSLTGFSDSYMSEAS
jgi:hypothetical protein